MGLFKCKTICFDVNFSMLCRALTQTYQDELSKQEPICQELSDCACGWVNELLYVAVRYVGFKVHYGTKEKQKLQQLSNAVEDSVTIGCASMGQSMCASVSPLLLFR